jgi:type I restriction enzyme, S subunit
MSWRTCQLGDVLELRYGKSLPDRDRKFGDIPVYGSGGIGGWHDVSLVSGPGVIVGRKGSVGSVFYESRNFFPIDTTYYVVPKDGQADLRYAYYLLCSLPLASMNSDVAVPGLNRDRALGLEIRVPSYAVQLSIADLLSTYDDLIENNRRRMALLEESARLLYGEWFIRLRFPGYEHTPIVDGVLQGWQRAPLESALVLQRGFDLPTQDRKEGDVPIYGSTGILGHHDKVKAIAPGVVTGRSGTLGEVQYVAQDYWPLNTALWVKEFKRVTPLFALFLLREMDLKQFNGGASVPTLDRKSVHRVEILIPPALMLRSFDEFASDVFMQIKSLTTQNEKLRTARDLLLPRLMSGELAV